VSLGFTFQRADRAFAVRRAVALLPLALLLVLAPGCGSEALELDPVAEAAAKTSEAGSSKVDFSMSMKGAGMSIDLTGSGAFDFVESRGALTYRMNVPELGRMSMEMRMVGSRIFMRMPTELGGELPEGKSWIGIDVGKALDDEGLGAFDFTSQQDPAEMLRILRAASDDVRESGSATIRGVATKRYVGRMDLHKAIEVGLDEQGIDGAEREKARRAMERLLEQTGSVGVPFEVFLDQDGLVRRVTQEYGMTIEGEKIAMDVAMDFFDFGVQVDVRAPPEAEVFDVTDETTFEPEAESDS
jgi:hypothetical protein